MTETTPKTLAVFGDEGVGKKALIGSLVFKCGGLELHDMQELESQGIRGHSAIVSFYKERSRPLPFRAPSAQFFVEETATPDVAAWVVDATTVADGKASSAKLAYLLSSGEVKPRDKLLVAVNKMDKLDWSESRFLEIVKAFTDADLGLKASSIVPVSGLKGDNIATTPGDPSWVTSPLVKLLAE